MKEAYLTTSPPLFTRDRPLNKAEQLLLTEAQDATYKARYTYHDCQQHGIFRVDNDLGLAFINCPRSKKCLVREVFDPAGYLEHYTQPAPVATPEAQQLSTSEAQRVDQLLELPGEGLPPAELRRRMEAILGCTISAEPDQLLAALREGLAGIKPPERPEREHDDLEEPEAPDPYAELSEIGLYASQMFSQQQVCTMVGLNYETERYNPDFIREFERGRLLRQSRVRSTIFLHAELGSAPAQVEALKLIRYAQIAEAGND